MMKSRNIWADLIIGIPLLIVKMTIYTYVGLSVLKYLEG